MDDRTDPVALGLERLSPEESEVYRILRDHELGTSVRLEQERVSFDRVVATVSGLWA